MMDMEGGSIAIIANGSLSSFIVSRLSHNIYIGVDRGALWLMQHKVIPAIAIGDFDSVSRKELVEIQKVIRDVRVYPRDKDQTDLELGVRIALDLKPSRLDIFGATGGRLDHTLGAIQLLEICDDAHIPARIIDEQNVCAVVSGRIRIKPLKGFLYVSLLPITDSIIVTLSGFRYSAERKTIRRGLSIGISNEIIGIEAEIIIHKGKALIVQSRAT